MYEVNTIITHSTVWRELLRVLKKGSDPQEEKSDLHEEKKNLQEEKKNLQEEKANRQLRRLRNI